MKIEDIKKSVLLIDGDIFFDQSIKNLNWFNIGGKTKIFFKPNSLKGLIEYLKLYSSRGKIFILGNGSNVLFDDDTYQGTVIKLGKNFSNITLLDNETIIAGAAASQKKVSEFAKDNNISGLEFMSCIPGSIGGGIRMNSGCFKKEFSKCFKMADTVLLCPIYTANEKLKLNFTYHSFAKLIIKNSSVKLIQVDNEIQLRNFIRQNTFGKKIYIGMGAGSISNWMKNLKNIF